MTPIEGVEIIIYKTPEKWCSVLGGERPFELVYPIQGMIIKADIHQEKCINVLIDGVEYGFSVEYLNDFDLITL